MVHRIWPSLGTGAFGGGPLVVAYAGTAGRVTRELPLANDRNWPGLPVRGQRRQQPFEQMRAERLVLDAASSTCRHIAAYRASSLNVCKM